MTSRPCTIPMPATTPPEGRSSIPSDAYKPLPPARAQISKKALPGSMISAILLRGRNFPRSVCKATARSSPPDLTALSLANSSSFSNVFLLLRSCAFASFSCDSGTERMVGSVMPPSLTLYCGTNSSEERHTSMEGSEYCAPRPSPASRSLAFTADVVSSRISSWPSNTATIVSPQTCSPALQLISTTIPFTGETISVSIFIALSTTTTSPTSTWSPAFFLTSSILPVMGGLSSNRIFSSEYIVSGTLTRVVLIRPWIFFDALLGSSNSGLSARKLVFKRFSTKSG